MWAVGAAKVDNGGNGGDDTDDGAAVRGAVVGEPGAVDEGGA